MLRPMAWPKVSVIVVTYNRPEMLVEAVNSVLDQTFCDFEVIVVDDGSNTATKAIAHLGEKAAERQVGLYVMDMEENSGYNAAPANAALLRSSGSYIAWLDDDNLWDPEHLDVLVTEIEKMGTDAVYSNWRYASWGEGGKAIAKERGLFNAVDRPFTPMTHITAAGLSTGPMCNFIDTSAMLISKAAFVARMGPKLHNEEIRRFGDWEFVRTSLTKNLRWRGIDRTTFTYRWHTGNLTLTRDPHPVHAGAMRQSAGGGAVT